MRTTVMTLLFVSISSVALAKNTAVEMAAAKMKSEDVRTLVTEVENTDDNPCMPEGKSFQVDLQIKQPRGYNAETGSIMYVWETVKTIGVDADGNVMEFCAE